MAQDDSKYTKPALRERIKKRITAGSKGGKPGQWSARKAQMVAAAYKKAGGGYKGGKGKKQKDLKRWGKEKWMTRKEYEKKKKKIRWLLTPLIWLRIFLIMNGGQILLVKSQEHMNVQEDQINLKNGSQNNHYGNKHL